MTRMRVGLRLDEQGPLDSSNRLDLMEMHTTSGGVYMSPAPQLFGGMGLHAYLHSANKYYPEPGFGFKTYDPLFKTPSLTLGQLVKNAPHFFNSLLVEPEPDQEAFVTVMDPKKMSIEGMVTRLGKYVLMDAKKLMKEVFNSTYYLRDTSYLATALQKLKFEGILRPGNMATITTEDSISYYVYKKQVLPAWAYKGNSKGADELGGLVLTYKRPRSKNDREGTLTEYSSLFNPHADKFLEFFDNVKGAKVAPNVAVGGIGGKLKTTLSAVIGDTEIKEL